MFSVFVIFFQVEIPTTTELPGNSTASTAVAEPKRCQPFTARFNKDSTGALRSVVPPKRYPICSMYGIFTYKTG